MKTEAKAWKSIRQRLNKLEECHADRIESSTSPGFPDVVITYKGVVYFFELKATATEARTVDLRPAQGAWFRLYRRAGGRPWSTLVFRSDREELYLVDSGKLPSKLKDLSEDEKKLIKNIEDIFID